MSITVSIVITVYNLQKYLERCAESVRNQTFAQFEAILVDDGSTDGSGRICDQIAEADDRFIVVHQENHGLSHARNRGVEAAHGEYITFIDGDDYIEPYYLEYFVKALQMTKTECACARIDRVQEDKLIWAKKPELKCEKWSAEEGLSEAFLVRKTTVSSCNKLALRELYLKYPFTEGAMYEDLTNTYKIFIESEKIAFVDAVLYHYAMNAGSLTARMVTTKKQCLDYHAAINECVEKTTEKFPDLVADANILKARDYMSLYLSLYRCKEIDGDLREIQKQILRWFDESGLAAARNKKAPLSVRLRIILMRKNPKLYKHLYYKGIKYKGKVLK